MRSAATLRDPYPFLFVGQGVSTSYKSLECYAWLVQIPSAALKKRIIAKLPLPTRSFVQFSGDVICFASDDRLEIFVKAAYDAKYSKTPFKKAVAAIERILDEEGFDSKRASPTPSQWAAFCADFEKSMHAIDRLARLRCVLKNDLDGRHHQGAWHVWSLQNAYRLADIALSEQRTLAGLFMRLLEHVLPERGSLRGWSPIARHSWLAWLVGRIEHVDRDLRDELGSRDRSDYRDSLVRRAKRLVDSFPSKEQGPIVEALAPSLQHWIAERI